LIVKKEFRALLNGGLFCDGDWVESKDQNPFGEVRLIQLADIGVGEYLDKSNRFMTLESAKNLKCTFLEKGDILIARMPDPIGRACIFPGDVKTSVTVVDVCIARPNPEEIYARWLMHMINSSNFHSKIIQYVTGTTRQRISRSNLASLEVDVPTLEEQKRIAAILDKADAIRRKRQEAIKLADEFLRAVFLDMFGDPVDNPKGWGKKSIYEVAPFAPNRQIKVSDESKVWLLNLDQVESNTGKVLSKHICEYADVGNSTLWFDESHVLYCKLRPYLNKVVMPDSIGLATSELIPLKPNPDYLNREFLTMYLRSEGFVNWARNKVAGAKMPRLSPSEFREHQIILPSTKLQNEFSTIFNKVDVLTMKNEMGVAESHANFEALSQKFFSIN
jgi:type I restriction enzyme S subunit